MDKTLKHEIDNPSIDMMLCKNKDKVTVEYALKYNTSPISVAIYKTEISETLPKELKASLPTLKEVEAEIDIKGTTTSSTHSHKVNH